MELISLTDKPSVFGNLIAEMRDKQVQKDSFRFRANLELAGTLMAYEISKHLNFQLKEIESPLANATEKVVTEPLVLVCVLRASLPMFNGFLKVFREAETAFIGAMRKEDGHNINAEISYLAMPDLRDKTLLFIDPMLATGKSLAACYQNLTKQTKANKTIVASLFAAPEGISYITKEINPLKVFVGSVDKELNAKSYIVPGLGDAGDLAFGNKL
ncbi:MAG: uracil phosphoribosyltransferase [Bacteroidetes bacterium]|nr:uracil phosphoribosyltransferase [Bacteroidota bacterium]